MCVCVWWGGGGGALIASHLNGENHSGGDSVALDCRDRVFFWGWGEGASSRCCPSECRINLVVRERESVWGGGGGAVVTARLNAESF